MVAGDLAQHANIAPSVRGAVSKGARRIWAERSIATPPNWPVHPFARCYRLGG